MSSEATITEIARIPSNIEAEKSVLASVFLDSASLALAADILVPDDFYNELHRRIYDVMLKLAENNSPIELPTVYAKLQQDKRMLEAGGIQYLLSLTQLLPSAVNVKRYAELVREAALLRRVVSLTKNANYRAQLPVENVADFISNLHKEIFELTLKDAHKAYFTMREVMQSTFSILEELYNNDNAVPGVSTGFIDLDAKTSGFRPGTLNILAARPAMGKTALALNFLTNAAIDHGVPAAFFSLEMTKEELGSRILCSRAMLHGELLRSGKLGQQEWNRLLAAMQGLLEAQIYVDESSAISITKLQAKARRLKEERNIGLIIIDYLQLMRGSSTQHSSREQEISEISRNLKALAKELSIPIIALSQLNRGVESRPDKRPMLSDLRESGAIEQDADIIMFIYRDDYYNKESPEKGISEVILAKQRSGPTGTIKLRWMGEYTLFANLAQEPDRDF